MKTIRNVFRKMVQLTILVLLVSGMQSCETEIPPEDLTPPEFIFQITGDGFFHEFNQDSDFDNFQLNLKNDTRYNYVFSGSDQGGVDLIQWFVPGSYALTFENPIPAPWTFSNSGSLQSVIEWVGDRSNPLTGQAQSDHFTVRGNNIGTPFRFFIRDFGGANRTSNELSKELNVYIGNHDTELKAL